MTDDSSSLPAAPEKAEKNRKSGGSRAVGIVRATAVVLLMTIGALIATISVPAIWGRNLVLNTDRYVSTLKPLASNPGVQAGIIKAIDAQIESHVDVSSIVKGALPGRAGSILAGPLESATGSLVNTVTTKFVESKAFVTLWTSINRVAHKQVVAILTGSADDRKALNIKNDQVVLNLQPVVDAVKAQLVSSGLTVAAKVPAVNTTIEIANVKGVDKARSLTKLVNKVANWLPFVAIILLLAAIGLSRRRRRGTIIAGMSVALGMVILAIAIAIGRAIYLNKLPGVYFSNEAAKSIYNTLVHYLRDGIRIVLGGALLVCLIAWLSGPSKPAKSIRKGPVALVRLWQSSPAAVVVGQNRGTVAGVVFGIAALVLVLWSNPTILVVIVIAAIALVLLLLAFFSKGPQQAEPSATAAG